MKLDLRLGDCLDLMKEIPDGSVDMICTDLPYGTTACKWDSVIPFAPLWEQYKRIAKPNTAIVLTAGQPFTSALIASNLEMFKYCWIWKKPSPTGFLNCNYRPLMFFEDIAVFSLAGAGAGSKQNQMKYYPQGLVAVNRVQKNRQRGKHIHETDNVGANNVLNSGSEYVTKFKNYPGNILEYPRDLPQVHPTQKPVALMAYLIQTYTQAGETVLDSCMGSGTTGVACMNLARKFIGIEKDEKYFQIASDRIRAAVPQAANDGDVNQGLAAKMAS